MVERWDAVVIGSGPNGLAAAVELGARGRSVLVLEANDTVGGGLGSDEIDTGLVRDRGAAIMPFAPGSPFFVEHHAALASQGLRWIHPGVPYTHPLDGGRVGVAWTDLDRTADQLGSDAKAYRRLVGASTAKWPELVDSVLGPIARLPRHPLVLARYGLSGMRSARRAGARFTADEAPAMLAGCAAHGMVPLEHLFTSAFATLFMAAAHAVGWPMVEGGSGRLAEALASLVIAQGGEIRTSSPVESIADLPPHRALLFDTDPAQLDRIAGDRLSPRYRRRLRSFRRGPGICKVDHVLDGPVPWADPHSAQAGTVHVGGTLDEVALAEAQVAAGSHPERPFVLVAQQSRFDPTRTVDERQVLWSYTHVPAGSPADRSEIIERQIERFAPGFRDRILHREVTTAPMLASLNRNFVGGDITGGAMDGTQLFARPRLVRPHHTSAPHVFLCSASTPPGGGIHCMGGRWAAKAALDGPLR